MRIIFPSGAQYIQEVEKPDEDDFIKYKIKGDCQSPYWDFHARIVSPAPQVNPVSNDPLDWPDTVRIPFTKDLQFYHANNLAWRLYGKPFYKLTGEQRGKIVAAFNGTTGGDKFFCDGNGTEEYANFITKERLDKGLPKWQGKLCGGIIVWSRHSWPRVKGVKGWAKGKWMRRLVALKGSGPFPNPDVNPLNEKYIFDGNVINKNCTTQQFPQLTVKKNGITIVTPVPFALICVNEAWYLEDEMELIS